MTQILYGRRSIRRSCGAPRPRSTCDGICAGGLFSARTCSVSVPRRGTAVIPTSSTGSVPRPAAARRTAAVWPGSASTPVLPCTGPCTRAAPAQRDVRIPRQAALELLRPPLGTERKRVFVMTARALDRPGRDQDLGVLRNLGDADARVANSRAAEERDGRVQPQALAQHV